MDSKIHVERQEEWARGTRILTNSHGASTQTSWILPPFLNILCAFFLLALNQESYKEVTQFSIQVHWSTQTKWVDCSQSLMRLPSVRHGPVTKDKHGPTGQPAFLTKAVYIQQFAMCFQDLQCHGHRCKRSLKSCLLQEFKKSLFLVLTYYRTPTRWETFPEQRDRPTSSTCSQWEWWLLFVIIVGSFYSNFLQ